MVNSKTLQAIAKQLVTEIQAVPDQAGQVKRVLTGELLKALTASVSELVRQALVAKVSETGYVCTIALDRNEYKRSRYQPYSYRIHVERAYTGLIKLKYLRVVRRGYINRLTGDRARTEFEATPKLMALFEGDQGLLLVVTPAPASELIRIQKKVHRQDLNGKTFVVTKRIEYGENTKTKAMRRQMQVLNKFLLRHWIDLELSKNQWTQIEHDDDEQSGQGLGVDITKRTLYRVFNDADFTQGGRLYGGWWQQIPRAYRSVLTIDGYKTVELDYSAMHPTMLFAMENISVSRDPYGKVLGTQHRDLVKVAFNAMLNAAKPLKQAPKSVDLARTGLVWSEVEQAIKQTFPELEKHFYSGIGLRLQYQDSEIALAIMIELAQQGIVVLPVHDSFVVQQRHENKLLPVMRKHFINAIARCPKIKPQTDELRDAGLCTGELIADFTSNNPAIVRLIAHKQWAATR